VAILIDNAIRHSPTGGAVQVGVQGDSHPGISVEDEGPGIRSEDLPHVFDRFWRAADAPDGGTGLGLAIAAWIAEHHGGRITATNRPAGGARFEVQLPHA
jgi:two-component system OmpR family sensor kinase